MPRVFKGIKEMGIGSIKKKNSAQTEKLNIPGGKGRRERTWAQLQKGNWNHQ